MKHTCSQRCQIQHLIIGDFLQLAGCRNFAWICGINAVYICIDFTGIRMKSCRQSNCRSIRSASAKCSIIIIFVNSLKTGNYNNLTACLLYTSSARSKAYIWYGKNWYQFLWWGKLPSISSDSGQFHGLPVLSVHYLRTSDGQEKKYSVSWSPADPWS